MMVATAPTRTTREVSHNSRDGSHLNRCVVPPEKVSETVSPA